MITLPDFLPSQYEGTLLRHFVPSDLAQFHAYRSDPALARFQGWSSMSEPAALQFIAGMASVSALRPGDWIQLAVADPISNRLLGDVGMFLASDEREGEVGFTLERAAHGQGHATRALRIAVQLFFHCTQVSIVRAVTDARNVASIRVLERVAFKRISEQRSEFKGELCTEFVYQYRRADA